jgi:hypothetical protein
VAANVSDYLRTAATPTQWPGAHSGAVGQRFESSVARCRTLARSFARPRGSSGSAQAGGLGLGDESSVARQCAVLLRYGMQQWALAGCAMQLVFIVSHTSCAITWAPMAFG